jgi:hypothetical protein
MATKKRVLRHIFFNMTSNPAKTYPFLMAEPATGARSALQSWYCNVRCRVFDDIGTVPRHPMFV